ncbi:Lrp/AsnC family transcriptional regulator [Pseudoteredinibacter isoporae]|uniref:Lrp/AsnC family leucine-responsive transcriptional regulator n=1 Tax=Pseudoteredinibacter isoporae TaxID=570281 RepID=A0A7X0MXX4_9GAMM|nr:Lrp/AsnC family transcriptional regulator [Pseudoteredinibacter isoporae]MBB6523665.1 Lrp/AsnC family leucine-responsive transcriptional regulator [Pseudoteredinibacter isoporae]NHO89169.1 Lrp/AsnC family transcriptional regulator [Pseudoteredinibacter isoporae]NIB22220.1 Lrp/AsnC family transcriptional regulator [Pseudoteredinibacter isoporae]
MSDQKPKFSASEKAILAALQREGRMSNVELAQQVGLSESPCFRRVKQLEDDKVITAYCAVVDQRRLGLEVTAFVQVDLEQGSEADTDDFMDAVRAEEYITECYAMSGEYDYLLKVVARNIDHFGEISMKRILKFPGVKNIVSSFNLLEVKNTRQLPLS